MANLALPGTLAAATAAGLPAATDPILSLDAMCHALWQAPPASRQPRCGRVTPTSS